jgi:hypothetical protein
MPIEGSSDFFRTAPCRVIGLPQHGGASHHRTQSARIECIETADFGAPGSVRKRRDA